METGRINEEEHDSLGLPPVEKMVAPPGYFEEFPDRVLNRWRKEQSQPKARIHWVNFLKVAAAVLVIAFVWKALIPADKNAMQPISSLEAYQYIEENIEQFEGLIETGEINFAETIPELNQEAVEEYLLESPEGINPEDFF